MEKLICLLWAPEGVERQGFNTALLEQLRPALMAAGATAIRLNLEDEISAAGAHLRQSRGARQHDALIQFRVPSDDQAADQISRALSTHCAQWHGWTVAETVVIANSAHPATAGQRTPGWAQTAFLTLPDRLTHDQWRHLWQEQHTPVAVETQANFEYVQNLVLRPLTKDAPPYVAIVEECFPEAALTDPLVFFDAPGNPAKFKANLDRMMQSCDRFIVRGTIDVIPTGQYNC
ncbi:MAG: EthD domain-containing protein [Novosphingobium sp.]